MSGTHKLVLGPGVTFEVTELEHDKAVDAFWDQGDGILIPGSITTKIEDFQTIWMAGHILLQRGGQNA